jgi:N-formylglutamate amidohydrolase
LDDAGLRNELLRMTDAYTDELFPVTPVEAGCVVFPISRLVCDVERFSSDEDEPMAARGMGVIYTRTSQGEPLRSDPTPLERQHILDRWYWPHHLKLERLVNEVISQMGQCIIIDCHSFPSIALPYEMDHSNNRPDICIGTDPFHTPTFLSDALIAAVKAFKFSVAINTPFAGALVPIAYYRKDRRVWSVMIEVNRRVYMDEKTGLKNPDFTHVWDDEQ